MIPILPDVDIWLRAFSRQEPDPLVVHAFAGLVRERRVVLVGGVRQALLTRVRDERQFNRLGWILSGFPEVIVRPEDHELAATHARTLRLQGKALSSWPALLWAVADRLQAQVWSRERPWSGLAAQGCPLFRIASSTGPG